MSNQSEPDTLPMFKAAPIATQPTFSLVYCNKCGCTFLGNCGNQDHIDYLEKRSLK
jgi:hypothetical protein